MQRCTDGISAVGFRLNGPSLELGQPIYGRRDLNRPKRAFVVARDIRPAENALPTRIIGENHIYYYSGGRSTNS